MLIALSLMHVVAEKNDEGTPCGCALETGGVAEYFCSVMDEVWEHETDNFTKPVLGDPPASFSWKDNGGDWTTPARYQGNCGSCWAFAAVSALESIINIREGVATLDPDVSEQYILSCLPSSGSCHGGSPYLAYYYLHSTGASGDYHNGIIPEECFPYQARDDVPCSEKCADWEEKLIPIADYGYWIPDGSEEDRNRIKTQVMEDGPVVTFMMATEDFQQWGLIHHGQDDYYPYPGYVPGINHCVIIVGWKDDPSIPRGGYWICKNSWGTYWGYDGFFNIEYGSLSIDNYEIVWVDYDAGSVDFPPVAEAGGPYHGSAGEDISFDGSGSRDAEGTIVSWEWDFGDGNTASGEQVTHSYTARGVYTVSLTVTDESGKKSTDTAAVFVDTWQKNDRWVYTIDDITIHAGEGFNASLEAHMDTLKITVDDTSYTLHYRGRIMGEFAVSSQPPMDFTGNLLFVWADGTVAMDSNFGIQSVAVGVYGIATITFEGFPLPLPVPFKATGTVAFDRPFYPIAFPLVEGKEWHTPACTLSMEITASTLFGMLKIPISYEMELGALNAVCEGKETVTVQAGTFEAYRVSYLDMLTLYYAPEVATIIELSAAYDDIEVHAELKDTTYQ